jgi:hypothetical protein
MMVNEILRPLAAGYLGADIALKPRASPARRNVRAGLSDRAFRNTSEDYRKGYKQQKRKMLASF